MQYEKFRKVLMLASLTGSLVVQTPAAAGDRIQYMPALLADAMKLSQEIDATLPANEKQNQFYKNGVEKIYPEDYYAHTVSVAGQLVTEYRTDEPAALAPKNAPAPAPAFDAAALGASIAQGLAEGLRSASSQADDIEEVRREAFLAGAASMVPQSAGAPAPAGGAEPSADTKAVASAPAAQTDEVKNATDAAASGPANQVLSTTVNNIAAGESPSGAVQQPDGLGAGQTDGTQSGQPGADTSGNKPDDAAAKTAVAAKPVAKKAPGQSGQ